MLIHSCLHLLGFDHKKKYDFKYPRRNIKVSRSLPNINKIKISNIYDLEEVHPIVVKAEPISEEKFNDVNSNIRSNYCRNFFSSIFKYLIN